jgi:Protein of unknown function (DUF2844)
MKAADGRVLVCRRAPAIARAAARVAALAAMLAASTHASAVLGGDVSTIPADQARLKGARQRPAALRLQVQTHEITLADGSSIREYVTPDGIVFAVAWSTRLKPNLDALLGAHAANYAAAAREAARTPGIKRAVVLGRDDLVVQSSAHLNTFVGRAYLRSRVPAGMSVDELR